MASDHWATELAYEILNRSGGSGSQSAIMMATVASTAPFSIKLHDQTVTKNLFVNPAYRIVESDNKLADAPAGNWSKFLKEFHKALTISTGDQLVVLLDGTSFYILEKVVQV